MPERKHLEDIIDVLTEDEATQILRWLATNRPTHLRAALRVSTERVRAVYAAYGRPHS
jgi:hypothetical protein